MSSIPRYATNQILKDFLRPLQILQESISVENENSGHAVNRIEGAGNLEDFRNTGGSGTDSKLTVIKNAIEMRGHRRLCKLGAQATGGAWVLAAGNRDPLAEQMRTTQMLASKETQSIHDFAHPENHIMQV